MGHLYSEWAKGVSDTKQSSASVIVRSDINALSLFASMGFGQSSFQLVFRNPRNDALNRNEDEKPEADQDSHWRARHVIGGERQLIL